MKRQRYAEGTVLRAAAAVRPGIVVGSRVRIVEDSGNAIDFEMIDEHGEVYAMAGMPAHAFFAGVDWEREQ